MKSIAMKVKLTNGFDARDIALLVQTASQYDASIKVTKGPHTMNAKSLMGMAALGLSDGNEILLEANGQDEEEALEGIRAFLTR